MNKVIFKKSYFLSLVILFCLAVHGHGFAQSTETKDLNLSDEQKNFYHQTKQGNFYFGFDYGMGFTVNNKRITINDSKVNVDFLVSPMLGYYIKDRWLLGVHFDNAGSVLFTDYNNKSHQYYYSTGIFSRYYLKGGVFGEVKYGLGSGFDKYTINGVEWEYDLTTHKGSFGVGISNYWMKRISLDLIARYNFTRYISDTEEFDVITTRSYGLTISAGISILLGKK